MTTLNPNTTTPSARMEGTVKFSDPMRGFGYIARDGQPDLFFLHLHLLGETPRAPRKGERVSFDEVKGRRGSQAINVCNLDDPQSVLAFNEWMTSKRQAFRVEAQDTQKRYEDYFKSRLVARPSKAVLS